MYEFKFWQQLSHPAQLTHKLENSEDGRLKGYKKCLLAIFGLTVLFFIARNIWGMNTVDLTALLVNGEGDLYSFARMMSLIGAVLAGILFFIFHYYGVTYFIYLFTHIPYRWIQKVQLYVIGVIVLEKLVTMIVFAIAGFATPFTMFSLAPMVAYVYYQDYLLFFLNQLTITTVVTIWIQYTFFSQWVERPKALLVKLIIVQVVLAALVALYSILPVTTWIEGWLGL